MRDATGRVFSTGGDESWPVSYRIQMTDAPNNKTFVTGSIEFAEATQLQTRNAQLPVYLELNDGKWAAVYSPVESQHEARYRIGAGSHLIEAPPCHGSQ